MGPLPREAARQLGFVFGRSQALQTLPLATGQQHGFWVSMAWSRLAHHCFVGPRRPRDGNRRLPRIHSLVEAWSGCGRGHGGGPLIETSLRHLLHRRGFHDPHLARMVREVSGLLGGRRGVLGEVEIREVLQLRLSKVTTIIDSNANRYLCTCRTVESTLARV